jgi:nucleoside-diphosphate-sugar epimerase
MKVLFVGGTGLISSAVSKLAVESGCDLFLLNRGKRGAFVPPGATVLHADIDDTAAVRSVLKDHSFDVVVDFIIFEAKGIERDIELFRGKTAQYIFISTAATYQRPPAIYVLDESTPQYNPGWDYARNKIACEERLTREYRDTGFPMTIVRPSHTYGITSIPFAINSWTHPWTLADRILKGRKVVVPGDGTSLWTLTHNSDFAKGLVGLFGNAAALGHAFHVTSDEVKTWNQYLGSIGRSIGVEPRAIHMTSECISTFMPEQRAPLFGDTANSYILDNSKIKRFVPGYSATTPFEQGIRTSVAWFREDGRRQTIDEAMNARMDAMIEAYEGFLEKAKSPG